MAPYCELKKEFDRLHDQLTDMHCQDTDDDPEYIQLLDTDFINDDLECTQLLDTDWINEDDECIQLVETDLINDSDGEFSPSKL